MSDYALSGPAGVILFALWVAGCWAISQLVVAAVLGWVERHE